MSTITYNDTNQSSGQPSLNPIIKCTGQQDAIPNIHPDDSPSIGHETPSEGSEKTAMQSERTDGDQGATGEALLNNSVVFASSAAADQQIPQADPEEARADMELDPSLNQQVVLKDISFECSQPHQFNDNLTMVILHDGNSCQTLQLAKASPTKWSTVEHITLSTLAHCDITLCVQLSDEIDEAFYTITTDEMNASMSAEKETVVQYAFTLLNKDDSVELNMSSTISNRSTTLIETPNDKTETVRILEEIEALTSCLKEPGNIDKITQLISLCEVLLSKYSTTSNVISKYHDLCNTIGSAFMLRFQLTANVRDIDLAIKYIQNVVQSTPSGHSALSIRCTNLGNAYMSRFKHTRNAQDIDDAISHWQNALHCTHSSRSTAIAILLRCSVNLGNAYEARFNQTGNIEDITHAIKYLEDVIQLTPLGHANFFGRCNNLGNAYVSRFRHTANVADIEHAVSYLRKAVESIPPGHPDLPSCSNNLGTAYLSWFKNTGQIEDIEYIENAIIFLLRAVESTPSGSSDSLAACNNLGVAYMARFERSRNAEDIEHAISYLRNTVQFTPIGHADFFGRCNNDLGSAYLLRFLHTGDIEDIENAISYLRNGFESTASDHAGFLGQCNNLGAAYMARFKHTGHIEDIERTIMYLQKAVESTLSGHSTLPLCSNNLGSAYMYRFQRTGDKEDIERAIAYILDAVQSTPSDHADFLGHCNNLGVAYTSRFKHSGNIQDIEHAISYLCDTVQSTPTDHVSFLARCNNLGNAYKSRFQHSANIKDIDHAISYLQKAIQSTPSDYSDLFSFRDNLGHAYMCRFRQTGDIQDIDHAILQFQKATQCTPSDNAALAPQYNNLGEAYKLRFECLGDNSDAEHSHTSFANGTASNGHPFMRLRCATYAAIMSLQDRKPEDNMECLTYFSIAIDLLAETAGLEQTIDRRYSNITDSSDLLNLAVGFAFVVDKEDLALEWLEQGRCLVWNQLGQLRTPIDKLMSGNRELADRFIKVATALESYGSRSIMSLSASLDTLAQEITQQDSSLNHTLHATEFKQILGEIRELPDFHEFLKPPKCSSILSSIPEDGPIIILAAYNSWCSALALIAGAESPLHISLENFSLEDAEKLQNMLQSEILHYRDVEDEERLSGYRRSRKESSMSGLLKELWCKVVQPIFETLAFSIPPMSSNRPRLWWCPTGPFSFLPLHAAGIYGSAYEPGSCVSDYVVSSYTPTVGSVSEKFAASTTSSGTTKMLVVSQPNTPGFSPLPETTTETHAIKAMMEEEQHVNTLLLENAEATVDRVKSEMASHGWVHFACHGTQDRSDPLQSGVHLHDGRLELLEIIRQKIPSPEFAFLSACQTSKGDLELSDEAVHLAAGMLASGYRGVVGTMWSISDTYGPDFAKFFYQYLLDEMGTGGLDSTRAAYALDDATRKVREKLRDDESSLLTWVPYVHFGY